MTISPQPTYTAADRLCADLTKQLPHVKSGALRMWGDWFGRPYDAFHQIVSVRADGSTLTLEFNAGETLEVDDPRSAVMSDRAFSIQDATRVRWEWFYYGRPQTPSSRYYIEYMRRSDGFQVNSNVDWCEPSYSPDVSFPAVELL